MADQTVKLSDLPLSSAKERVAFDLFITVKNAEHLEGKTLKRKDLLDLYAECLQATTGYRDWN